ncbi:hypothetical protein PYCCODRAFT_1022241 [Trametes coccinea BRFM310]|uniref:Uncharacterized protein n=1 Tax=Trametes coccinea (strain BRFM310) TaxID=1353009 RepID=A0A1Y2IAQ6_TRAC3|nr:hypothetical protein PYCCODRAFT_1022241 [Trametes coccinea BRFM310]
MPVNVPIHSGCSPCTRAPTGKLVNVWKYNALLHMFLHKTDHSQKRLPDLPLVHMLSMHISKGGQGYGCERRIHRKVEG